jgi:translation initiation factor 2B subunit (eIF-2B alpha/beta/delta family)
MDLLKSFREKFSLTNIKEQVSTTKNTFQIIEGLLGLLQDNKIPSSAKEMLMNLKTLVIDQPNIVSINHFINHFLLRTNPENLPIVLKELLEVFHERWKHVDRKTAQIAFNLYNFKNKRIAFYGSSDAMLSLVEICVYNHAHSKVIQILGNNDKEGKEQVKQMISKNVEIQAVDLYNLGRMEDEIDFIILSSDIIMQDTFIVKAGTNLISIWAKQNHIPVLVLSDSRKILNTKILPSSIIDSFIKEAPKSASDIWKSAPEEVKITNFSLEEVKNDSVDFFILEQQAFPPNELSQEVDKILISKFI